MKTQIHCTNHNCRQRKDCKKGQAMTDGNCVQFNFPSDVFTNCEHFECRNHNFKPVHGQKEKQCSKCGELEFDGIEYDDYVWQDLKGVDS